MKAEDYRYLIKDKFYDIIDSFDSYCNQGLSPEEAFNKACKENNINNWL